MCRSTSESDQSSEDTETRQQHCTIILPCTAQSDPDFPPEINKQRQSDADLLPVHGVYPRGGEAGPARGQEAAVLGGEEDRGAVCGQLRGPRPRRLRPHAAARGHLPAAEAAEAHQVLMLSMKLRLSTNIRILFPTKKLPLVIYRDMFEILFIIVSNYIIVTTVKFR